MKQEVTTTASALVQRCAFCGGRSDAEYHPGCEARESRQLDLEKIRLDVMLDAMHEEEGMLLGVR